MHLERVPPGNEQGRCHADAVSTHAVARRLGGRYRAGMLKVGDPAPDFPIGDTTLHGLLKRGLVAVYFFPKAFTPG